MPVVAMKLTSSKTAIVARLTRASEDDALSVLESDYGATVEV